MNAKARVTIVVEKKSVAVTELLKRLARENYSLQGFIIRAISENQFEIIIETDDRPGIVDIILSSIYEGGAYLYEFHAEVIQPTTGHTDTNVDLFQSIPAALIETHDPETKKVRWRRMMKANLTELFDENELKSLSFDMGIDWGDIEGTTRELKAMSMILYCERHGRKEELQALCIKLRPHATWGF